ncbi:UNKNOWN [Stylonychia lemnae]|uniref:Transmembrane protein n=1 Tax=Stylonychia lemnae TaxID=5949 RepID=A0A078ANP4_STYLE|nr:UNKNOWN [Stylonychia lemnae]|eukprot:CDW82588.1 UNKNOWN [Stylonychia lemnae]
MKQVYKKGQHSQLVVQILQKLYQYSKIGAIYFWQNVCKKEEIYTLLFLGIFIIQCYNTLTYDAQFNYFSLNTIKISAVVSFGLMVWAHIIDKEVEQKYKVQLKNYQQRHQRFQMNLMQGLKQQEQTKQRQLREFNKPLIPEQRNNSVNTLEEQKQFMKQYQEWYPFQRQLSTNAPRVQEPFKLYYNDQKQAENINMQRNFTKYGQQFMSEELPVHQQFKKIDRNIVIESMKSNFHRKIEASEHYFLEIARKTKQYTFNYTFMQVIKEYQITLRELCDILARFYRVVLVENEHESVDDLIDDIADLYIEHERFRQQEVSKSITKFRFISLEELLSMKISNIQSRYQNDDATKYENKVQLKTDHNQRLAYLLDNMFAVNEILRSVNSINIDYSGSQIYILKRMAFLIQDPEDYNYKGGSIKMLYKGQTWSKLLPSDPELVASVFCALLDDSYFIDDEKKKRGIRHYIDSTDQHRAKRTAEDQVALINTQHVGYVPYYHYVAQQKIHPVPDGKFNVFYAIAMIYAQIAKMPKQKYVSGEYHVAIQNTIELNNYPRLY